MHEQYGGEVQFVGIAGRDDVGAVNDFIAAYDVGGFTHAFDGDGSVWAAFGVTSQPTFAYVSADGSVDVQFGRQGEENLAERLDALVDAAAA